MSVVSTTVEYEGRKYPVSFASDDSIDIVRQRVAAVIDRYPDRLFMEVEVTLPEAYYKDPRRWEALFFRLAPQSQSMSTSSRSMSIYTKGQLEVGVSRDDWEGTGMDTWRVRSAAFPERFILGVEETQSIVLPIPPDAAAATEVPAARIPLIEPSRIFSSIHPHPVVRIHATEISTASDEIIKSVYAPMLRTGTPDRLSAEAIQTLDKNFTLWKKLMSLASPEPSGVHVSRARWQIPWIRTQWGDAVRARFEEILYGMTVDSETPYIGLFTNRDYGMQHKFWAVDRDPKLDLTMWGSWLQTTRPQRNRPTLLLYRGKDRQNFDRLAITSSGITANIYRSGTAKTSIEHYKKELKAWIGQLDALTPFIDREDLEEWELQNVSAELTYRDDLDDPNLKRLPCVSNIFLQAHPAYRLLRSDKTDRSLSDIEVGVLQILRRDIATPPEQIAESLAIPVEQASRVIDDIRERIDADPSILTQELDVMPKIEFSGTKAILTNSLDLPRVMSYTNLLRHVLTGTGAELAEVCPARMETVTPAAAVAPTIPSQEIPVEEGELEDDMADFLNQMGSAKKTAPNPLFNYYTTRLRKVDPDTFDTPYSKKCEPSRQVLLLTPEEQAKWKDTPYDPASYPAEEILETPSGVAMCPDYWCMKDEIPLRKEQLEDGKCPVCGGKIRDAKSSEPVSSAPVVARDTEYKYPRLLKDIVSSKNGRGMPCCYKQAKAVQVIAAPKDSPMDPFYILGELKKLPAMRVAYLPAELAKRLRLNVGSYKTLRAEGNRLKDRATGVFRVGLGRPSRTIGRILGIDIPKPEESIQKLFQCQFVRTWREPRDDDGTFDAALVPYMPDATARARMARLMAGVSAAYANGTLTQIQELEYISIATGTPMYRIDVESYTVSCGLWTRYFAHGRNAIALLETGDSIDILAYATHKSDMEWRANLYSAPFLENTIRVLRAADGKACATPFPSYQDAMAAAMRIGIVKNTPVVIDPTGFAQAIWSPQRYILPMRPDMVVQGDTRRVDYSEMGDDQLPSYESQRQALDIAVTVNPQFGWKRDIYDVMNRRVEIETQSGLRVPVVPEEVPGAHSPEEVIQTVRKGKEHDLVSGTPSETDAKQAAEISYTAEVLDFLLYTLSLDLQKEDYADLRDAVESGDADELEPPLEEWYDSVATTMKIDSPASFVKKVRTPCGQFDGPTTCKGVCGWKDGKCRIKLDQKKVGERSEASLIFARLVNTLTTNAKKRAVVLDGRVSPFFSTILYLELPHERFLTDAQIKWEKSQGSE